MVKKTLILYVEAEKLACNQVVWPIFEEGTNSWNWFYRRWRFVRWSNVDSKCVQDCTMGERERLRPHLVYKFKHMISVFKQHYTYFTYFQKNWKLLFKHIYQTDPKDVTLILWYCSTLFPSLLSHINFNEYFIQWSEVNKKNIVFWALYDIKQTNNINHLK